MAASEVKLLHLVVGLDFLGRALLEDAAVVQHGHALDNAQGHIHVVLDDDEADVLRHRGEDLDQLRPLFGRQASGRLVTQAETRCAGQRQGDLELALLSVAQLPHQAVADILQVHGLDQALCRLQQGVTGARADQRKAPARDAAAGEIDVVEHRQAGEQRRNLVGAAQAAADTFVWWKMSYVLAKEANGTRGRRKVAGDAVEQRRLAGAVGAEHGAALAGTYVDSDVGQCGERAEHSRDAAQLQRIGRSGSVQASGDGGRHGATSPPGLRSRPRRSMRACKRCHSPSTPSGEKNTRARKPKPMTSLNRSPDIPNASRISDENTLSSAYMSAPMKGPIGCLRPPTTAITRMSITCGMPAVPGTTWAFCQTSRMPPTAAITLANE